MKSLIPVDASGGVVYSRDGQVTEARQATQGRQSTESRQATQDPQATQARQDTRCRQATQCYQDKRGRKTTTGGRQTTQDPKATEGRQSTEGGQDTRGDQAPQGGGGLAPMYEKDDPSILLIYRRGVWDLPKGKREQGETFETCAVREVAEETGARTELREQLIDTVHEYEMEGEHYRKTTRWFSMELLEPDQQLTPEREEDIFALEWVPLSEAMERVGFENLVQVLEAFDKWWRGKEG